MMHRTTAKRWTRIAQGAAAATLALSAAGLAAKLPGSSQEDAPARLEIPRAIPTAATGGSESTARSDAVGTAARLSLVSNTPKPAPPPAPPPEQPRTETPPPVVSGVTYHGIVTVGSRAMALIKENARQRFVRLGDKVDNLEVTEIVPGHVKLGESRIVPLAEKSGGAVSRLLSVTPMPLAGQTARGIPGLDPSAMRDEQLLAAEKAKLKNFKNAGAPSFVPPEDVLAWRRLRAQMILSGEHNLGDPSLNELAYKLLGERRGDFKETGQLTPEELEAEAAFLDKHPAQNEGIVPRGVKR